VPRFHFPRADRYSEIERENRKLLDAMTKIMAKNTFADVQSSHDAELAHMRNLNRLARQRELDRIANANMVGAGFLTHCRSALYRLSFCLFLV
jgi:hypothetical protein